MQSIQLGIMFIAFLLRSCSSQVDFDANSFVEPVASTEIGRFCQNAIFISCQQVNVDLSAIRSGNTLTLPEGTQVQQKSLFPGSENNLVTAFYDSQDQKASLTITFSQDPDTVRVSGVIRVEDKVFNLVRCSLNNHACVALVEEEVKHLEDSGHELEDLEVPLERPVDRSTGTYQTDSDGNIIATVKVYFTLEFAKIELDIVGYVNNMIATANVGYMNSNIPFRLQLWCVELLEGVDESLLMPQLLPTLTTIKGDVTTLLDSADFAFVLLGERTDYCGRAYIGSLALPISIAQHSCAINSFSFGHEIGHNFGCRHNRESYQTGSSLPGYAFGYYFANAPFRTVLGKLVSGRTRINYFSNPNVSYQGHSTGTNASDCARQILENRIAYASIGSESQTCGTQSPTQIEIFNCVLIVTATIDGGWTEWSEWSCPAGCGQSAASQRTRDCINPPPLNGGSICQGPDFEMVNAPCSMPNACNCTNLRDNSYCEGFSWACQSTPSNVAIMLKNCRDTCNFCIDGKRQFCKGALMDNGLCGLMTGLSAIAPQGHVLASGSATIPLHSNPDSIALEMTLKPRHAREPIALPGLPGANGVIVSGLVETPFVIGRDLARPRNPIAKGPQWKQRRAMKLLVIPIAMILMDGNGEDVKELLSGIGALISKVLATGLVAHVSGLVLNASTFFLIVKTQRIQQLALETWGLPWIAVAGTVAAYARVMQLSVYNFFLMSTC
eukprot:TCALIF_05813-PA protein Name:"Similar to XCC0955 Peptidyl-Asp metalloendopeptidase (Xanthomonas campestris pv. campestris (strain ATCC 33913 / NCPPB 528 / LMG 568))" AED:0.07 eAED:0.09 QI:49/0.75/0.66/1/0.5/0.55/9/0/725